MGVDEVLVDPGLRLLRDLAEIQFPGRQHHLPVFPVDDVAVQVDPLELVVGADRLKLVVGVHQGPPSPESNVADGGLVGGHFLPGEVTGPGEVVHFDLVQVVGLAGQTDVVCQKRSLQLQLVGFHDEGLNHHGVEVQGQVRGPEEDSRIDGCSKVLSRRWRRRRRPQSGRRRRPGSWCRERRA